MKRTISFMLLLVMMSLILAACGGTTATTAPTAAPAAAAATAVPAAPATAIPPAPATAVPAPATEVPAATKAPEATKAPAATKAPEATKAPAASGSAGFDALKADASKLGPELADAFAGKLKGTKVVVDGPFADADAVKFNESMKTFEDATGIDVEYVGNKQFEGTIAVRVEGGNVPDIADFPQPGLLTSIAATGKVLDASKFLNADWLKENYNQGWLDIATINTPNGEILGGVFTRVNGKSLVWYPKDDWDAAGYAIPQTWEELQALQDQIVADGDTPWCIGIESQAATGWAATDWMEEIMLRTTSLENYDKWTSGELPFTDPIVKNAATLMSEIWFNDAYVFGGRKQIATTSFGDAPAPMFQDPPKCWLHKQGNFITSFFPAEAKAGVDYDFFYFPPIDPQYGKPVLVGGDIVAAFTDRPEVRAVMQYFTSFESVRSWIQAGGAVSPHKDTDLTAYGNDIERGVAEIILDADSVRFDASDLMPGAVGSGTFWKGMTDYVSGSVDLDQAMEEIQKGWEGIKK